MSEDVRDCIGIVEEYVDASWKRVSCDGFVYDGKMKPWCITDNVYAPDNPEKFDFLLVPTVALSQQEQQACWAALETIVACLHQNFGFDNQFVCVEFFVKNGEARVMEINPRISANQCPCFPRVLENGDAVEAMVRLQLGDCPPLPRPIPGRVGVALYRDPVPNTPEVVEKGEDLIYYDRQDKDAHVYAFGDNAETTVAKANSFYEELHTLAQR